MPIILLLYSAVLLYSCTLDITCWGILMHSVIMETIFSYSLFAMNWIPESMLTGLPTTAKDFGRSFAPRLVYCVGFGLLMLLALSKIYGSKERASKSPEGLFTATMSMLSAWSSTVLILLGTQGPFVTLICVIGGIRTSICVIGGFFYKILEPFEHLESTFGWPDINTARYCSWYDSRLLLLLLASIFNCCVYSLNGSRKSYYSTPMARSISLKIAPPSENKDICVATNP